MLNISGEICGTADNSEKPFLLFFDLTRCIKISAALGGCVTPQVSEGVNGCASLTDKPLNKETVAPQL